MTTGYPEPGPHPAHATVSAEDYGMPPSWMGEALDMGNTGLWTILLDQRTGEAGMFATDTMLRLLGLDSHPSPKECYTHWFSRIDPAYVPRVHVCVEGMISSGQQREVEYPWNHPKRGWIFVRCGGKTSSLPEGDPRLCLRGYHQDISDLHSVRQSLRDNLNRLEAACRIGSLGIFELVPRNGELELRANDILAEQLGMDLHRPLKDINAELQQRLEVFPSGSLSLLREPERWTPEAHIRLETSIRHPQRGQQRFAVEYQFMAQADGSLHAVGFTRDITQAWRYAQSLREAKENAEAANRAKSAFLANMSHEIRTPMNGIIGMTTLLRQTNLDVKQQDYVDKLGDLARSLLGVLNDILDFSKIEADKMDMERAPFQLSRVMGTLEGVVRLKVEQKGLDFSLQVAPGTPDWLTGDALRVRQILLNLCDNAVKFTPRGRVEVEVRAVEQQRHIALLEFLVRDEGIGISEEAQARLFEPFEQADASTTRHFGGTGLGLTISRRLADMMGGELRLKSEPGRGSEFRFTVPLALAEPQQGPGETLEDVSGLGVLVVEDNDINREIIVSLLESLGVRAETAVDGREAVAQYERLPEIDGILMDLQMPVMDGYEATRRIRLSDAPGADTIPIVALSANAMRGDAEKSLAAGMDGHLTKPVELTDLAHVLAGWKRRNAPA